MVCVLGGLGTRGGICVWDEAASPGAWTRQAAQGVAPPPPREQAAAAATPNMLLLLLLQHQQQHQAAVPLRRKHAPKKTPQCRVGTASRARTRARARWRGAFPPRRPLQARWGPRQRPERSFASRQTRLDAMTLTALGAGSLLQLRKRGEGDLPGSAVASIGLGGSTQLSAEGRTMVYASDTPPRGPFHPSRTTGRFHGAGVLPSCVKKFFCRGGECDTFFVDARRCTARTGTRQVL